MPPRKFRDHPRPDEEVCDLLESVLASARAGYVKAVAIVAVSPVNIVETESAGDLSSVRITALQGGLVKAALELMTRK